MIKSIFANKDSTIYSDLQTLNTGLDEILEIRNTYYKITSGNPAELASTVKSLSRILLNFDISTISQSVAAGTITNPKYFLRLNTADATALKTIYSVEVLPVSSSWDMGSGKKHSNPMITDGVSWKYRSSGSNWAVSGSDWNTTAEYNCSQSFDYEISDLYVEVTPIVNAWISSSIPNNGLIVKFPDSLETGSIDYGSIRFFSRDTHTIYPPALQVKWDDSSYSTGSLTPVDITSMVVYSSGLKSIYKSFEIARVSFFVRDVFPAKQFVTSSRYLTAKYMPTSSYYSVKDAHTDEVLIDFDEDSTKLSCNSNGHYFNFDMSGLQPERYYKFVLKVQNSENTIVIDDKFYFKVER